MSNSKNKLRLVVFDLDGTLIDSANDIIQTTHRYLRESNKPLIPAETIKNAIGEGLRSLLFNLDNSLHDGPDAKSTLKHFFNIYEEELCKTTQIFPGVLQTLQNLAIPYALLTNKGEKHARMTLEKLGLSHFPWNGLIGGDTLATKKPDPEGLKQLMAQAQSTPKTTLMVGDGLPDIRVANTTGCWSLACLYGYTRPHLLEAEKPHFFVEKSENLASAISVVDDLVRNGYKGPL